MSIAIEGMTRRATRTVRTAVLGLAILALAACVERIRSHGYVPDEEALSQITVGVDTRDTVTEVLGAPSTSGVVNEGGYYYVRSLIRHTGPTDPKVVEREVVAVSFDPEGVVQNIERYGLQDGREVMLSRRVTDNVDQSNGLIRQLLGSLGNLTAGGFLQ
ncbi:outer membrane protein assembly factor BamE [Pseudooceanicola sp.]|uniref:outer membrane protein assembly factor BamE n=1 Tax=Pseudooceanicola sp. TaxID=1914328 RepID=UPI004057DB33